MSELHPSDVALKRCIAPVSHKIVRHLINSRGSVDSLCKFYWAVRTMNFFHRKTCQVFCALFIRGGVVTHVDRDRQSQRAGTLRLSQLHHRE